MKNMNSQIIYKIKNNFLFRAIISPYMNYMRLNEKRRYEISKDSRKIASLKGKYNGERCFIIGNGPSLKAEDLDVLLNEYTFGANRIYTIFNRTQWRPTFYFAVDNSFIDTEAKRLNSFGLSNLFLATGENFDLGQINNAVRIFEYTRFKINKWNDSSAHISENVSQYFSVGYTVTFTEIQMAIYMGFKEIILLGVDFNYSSIRDKNGRIHENKGVVDYFSGEKYASTVLPYYSNLYAYKAAKRYADEHDIRILNATRGGRLEVFERIEFEDLVSSKIGGGGRTLSKTFISDEWRCAA